MIFAGIKNYEILKQYIRDIDCESCKKPTEHILIIYCKAFTLGLFHPFKWWAYDKKGYIQCTKCGTETNILKEYHLPQKILNYYHQTKIPYRYKLPSILLFGSLVTFGLLIMVGFFSAFISFIKPIDSKLKGQWKDEYGVYKLYIYDNNQYTVVGYDTIVFGQYSRNKNIIEFPFMGNNNQMSKSQIPPLLLYNADNEKYKFSKTKEDGLKNIYERENNFWRNKPNKPQSNEQLRQKILAYLRFEKNKFQTGVNKNLDFIEADPNAPLIFAMNGIAAKDQSLERWKYTFFNENDWEKANMIIIEDFPKKFKLNEKEKNIFKRNIDFLNFFINKIKTSKLQYLK